MDTIYSFAPIVDGNSRTLILGSMPGGESLRRRQYYGHPQNAFWRLMCALLGEAYNESYEERTAMLLNHGTALWDVLKSCEREGSLDSHIKNPVVNDFHTLFKSFPGIRRVFFNGQTAYRFFKKHVGFNAKGVTFTCLGSTSPAHAVPFEQRLADWRIIFE